MRLFLFEVTAAIDESGTEQTFYFAHGRAYSKPSAPGFYPSRLKNPINIRQAISSNLQTFGEGGVSAGEVTIDNPDGEYDYLLNHGYNRQARVLAIDSEADYSTAEIIMDGIVEQPTVSGDTEIVFRFRDKSQELKIALQPTRFAGTNSGGTGLEGLQNDIGGQVKPRLFGKALNIQPPLLNSVQLIYGWNFDRNGLPSPSDAVLAVRDGGLELDFGTNRASVADLQANAPAPGTYDTCLAASMIKLGSKPEFDVTLDVVEADSADANCVAHLVARMLLDAGVPSERISDGSINSFHAAAPYTAGYFARQDVETLTVINMLANAAGGFVQPSGPGIYEMGQLVEPGGTAAMTFREAGVKAKLGVNDADIVKIRPVVSNDEGRGVAAWQITLGYAKNWTVQSSFAGATTAEEQERYRGEVLKVTSAAPSVLTKYPQAPEITFDTVLTEQADAAAECARRADLYCAERAMYEIEAQFTISLAQSLKKGARVKVFARRYGLTTGRDFIITQFELNARTGRVIATLWG